MNKAIKYRLYPNKEQIIFFEKTFGCCRKLYNLMLSDKIESYNKTKTFLNVTPARYKKDYPYLREVDSLALANVQLNLQKAFKSHFDKKRKKQNGFPKFKSRKYSKKSYTTNNQKNNIRFENKTIKLPKVGNIKIVIHKKPNENWILKSVTVTKDKVGNYYASVLFKYEKTINKIPISDNVIGLDYTSDGLYIDSNDNKGTNHRFYRQSYHKLIKEQRKLSRQIENNIKGYKVKDNKRYPVYKKSLDECKNIQKQKLKIAKIHKHIANQRLDNLHKLSTEIANQYDVVCVETLNMKTIANKSFHNGKSTLDNGYGIFLTLLEYKLNDRGKYFVKVDKWFASSQLCSNCHTKHPKMKDIKNRKLECGCGLIIDRDYNSAINIKNEGLRLLKEIS